MRPMMHAPRLALALLFTLPMAAPTHAAEAPPASNASPGGALFSQRCGLCHRGSGPGVFMLERRLGSEKSIIETRSDLTADLVRAVVRQGIGSMPRFSRGEVTDAELAEIAAYLTRSAP